MIKRSRIDINGEPVTVRELTARDLLNFELGNEQYSEMWVFCDLCGINPYEISGEDRDRIISEFVKLNTRENGDGDGKEQSIIDVIAMMITRGHINVLDYGVTFLTAAIESIKEYDEMQAQIRLTTTAIGSRGTIEAIESFALRKKEKTTEEIKREWDELEKML